MPINVNDIKFKNKEEKDAFDAELKSQHPNEFDTNDNIDGATDVGTDDNTKQSNTVREKKHKKKVEVKKEKKQSTHNSSGVPEYIPPNFDFRGSAYKPLNYKEVDDSPYYTPSRYKPLDYHTMQNQQVVMPDYSGEYYREFEYKPLGIMNNYEPLNIMEDSAPYIPIGIMGPKIVTNGLPHTHNKIKARRSKKAGSARIRLDR
jgi:hypothetical protein